MTSEVGVPKKQTKGTKSDKGGVKKSEMFADVIYGSPLIHICNCVFLFQVKFWIEGVLLLIVGSLGFLGNLLTLAVLARKESFTQSNE